MKSANHNSNTKSSLIQTVSGAAALAACALAIGGIATITLSNDSPKAEQATPRQASQSGQTVGASVQIGGQIGAASHQVIATAAHRAKPVSAQAVAPQTGVSGNFAQPADFVPNNAEGNTDNAPFARIHLPQLANGQAAIDALGPNLAAVATWYGMSVAELSQLLNNDHTVHVDQQGRLLHIDSGVAVDHQHPVLAAGRIDVAAAGSVENADIVAGNVAATTGAPFPLDQTFTLHTRSKSTRVVYLNFKGEGSKPAFSLDSNVGTFSDAEKQMIQKIWLRMAEDYSAFDVDITTELPSTTTGKTGVTILITKQTSDAGGYAYLNSFSTLKISPAPAFCFQNNLANAEKPIAECLAHEVGHTLGLHHQGTSKVTYYGGAGDGETGWAPIMGVSYYKNLTQWAKGEYLDANNKEDAYAVMAKQGLSPRADDHGNTRAAATAMTRAEANGLANLKASGVIETPLDVDAFSFVAGAGDVSLKVDASAYSANLDVALELQDSTGKVVASANNTASLGSTLSTKLAAAGTYTLFVKGAGKGDPKTTGYSNYGSIGQYNITGSVPLSITPKAPVASIKTNVVSGVGPLAITFDASASTAEGSKIASYQWTFGEGTAGATTASAKYTYAKAGTYTATLKVTNASGQSASKTVTITVTAKK
jgi:hypothetical protein